MNRKLTILFLAFSFLTLPFKAVATNSNYCIISLIQKVNSEPETVGTGTTNRGERIPSRHIECLGALNVANKGMINLQCDRKIEVSGLRVAAGGTVNMDGNTVTLKRGTHIEKGGTLNIIYRQD